MGDWYQWIADVDAEPEKAAELGARLMDWLVQQGIIEREQTDCVLGAEAGHPPGPNYGRAVVEADDEAIDVWSNGLSMHVGRRAYVNSYVHSIRCPGCAASAEADDETGEFPEEWQPLEQALFSWIDGEGPAEGTCPRCGESAPFSDWSFDPPHAVAHLGVEVWNWPGLSPAFIAELSELLDGHRLVVGEGEL